MAAKNPFDQFDPPPAAPNPFDRFDGEPESSGGLRRFIGDPLVTLGKGAVGAVEGAIGLGNLATGGAVGKAADATGLSKELDYRKKVLEEYLTPEQRAANREVSEAKGATDTLGALARNPSTIGHTVAEALPAMAAGGVISRGALAVAPMLGRLGAGAAGEGAITAGMNAEQVRQETPGRELSLDQGLLTAGSGLVTGLISAASGGVARKLGIGDIETAMAGGANKAAGKGALRRTAEGFVTEGLIEEAPQSAQEQIAQNLALGKPWDEGVSKAATMGAVAGGVMGGAFNLVGGGTQQPDAPPPGNPPPPLGLPAPGQTTLNTPPYQPGADSGLADEAAQMYANSVYAARAAHDADQEALKASGKEEAPKIAGLLPPPSQVAPDLEQEPIGVIQDSVRQGAADNAQRVYAARAEEEVRLQKLAAQGPISGIAAAAIRSGLATHQQVQREGADAQELAPKEGALSMPAPATEIDQVKNKRLDQTLSMSTPGQLAAAQLARASDPKSWTVVPHPSGQGFTLAPTSYLSEQQVEAVAGIQEAGGAPAQGQASVPLANVQVAKRMADAETAKTGVEHEVVPHPTKRDAFTFRPVQNSQQFTQREQPQATEQAPDSAQDSQQTLGTSAQLPTKRNSDDAAWREAYPNEESPWLKHAGEMVDGKWLPRAAAAKALRDNANAAVDEGYSQFANSENDPIASAANAAATSPTNELPHPTTAQAVAGNYRKGHVKVHGLDVSVENPDGSVRVSKDGSWASGTKGHYGYIRGTKGNDGDQVDVNVGPKPESTAVFVINQVDPKTGKFDEHKVMLGYESQADAEAAYRANYPADWQGLGSIQQTDVDGLKSWLRDGDTGSEFAPVTKSDGAAESVAAERPNELKVVGQMLGEIPPELAKTKLVRAMTADEQAVADKVAQRLVRRKMPLVAFDGIDALGIYHSDNDGVYFDDQRTIALGARTLAGKAGHTADHALSHELWHNLFPKALGDIQALGIEERGGTRIPTGRVMIEAFVAWRKGGPLGSLLNYPLKNYRDEPGDRVFTEVLRQEVAAQLAAMYITSPDILQAEMPEAFSLMQEVADAVRPFDVKPEGEIGGARSAVQRALRRWRPAAERADGDVGRGAERDAGEGARDGRAGAGVDGRGAVRPEALYHRYDDATGGVGASAEQRGVRSDGARVREEARPLPNGPLGNSTPTVTLRKQQPDALTLLGVHHTKRSGISTLYGSMYGSATSRAAGEEWARLQEKDVDRRARERVYFYHQHDAGVPFAETAVQGGHVYRANLTNILDPRSDTALRMFKEAGRDSNGELNRAAFERLVIDGNYDGYVNVSPNGRRSMIVVLGGNVPVEYLGKSADVVQRPNALEVRGDDAPEVTQSSPAVLDDFKPGKVKGIKRKDGWAIITAENPNSRQLPDAMNAARNARLERDLQKMGAKFEKVVGKYGGNDEHSYIVVGITKEQAESLRDKHQQDSVLTRDGLLHSDGSVTKAGGVTEHTQAPADYFTRTASGAYFTLDLKKRTEATRVPDDIAEHLTKEELASLGEGRGRVPKLIGVMRELPPTRDFLHAALAGKAARGWYKRSREAVESMYGADSPRFISLMAALSPQTSVKLNFYNTARAWHAWDKAGRPTDPKRIASIFNQTLMTEESAEDGKSAMPAWTGNGTRALTTISPATMKLSGPKVESFRNNLMGDSAEVTNDRHNANFGGVKPALFGGLKTAASDRLVKGPGYIAFSARIRQAAAQLTKEQGDKWTPAEVQETLWSFWKALYDLATAKGETRSAVQLVRDGALTHEMVRRVPDLGSFFHEQDYREIAGPGAGVNPGARGVESPAEQGAARETGAIAATPAIERIARRADRLIASRKRLEELKAAVVKQDSALDESGVARAREIEQLEDEIARISAEDDLPVRPNMLEVKGEPTPLWESGLLKAVQSKAPFAKDGNIAVPMLKSWLAARAKDGTVKGEELKWSGVDEWLDALVESDVKKLSRGEVERFIEQNGVQVEEKVLGERALPPGIRQALSEEGRVQLTYSDSTRGYGDTAAEAATNLAEKFERLAQQWQKNGDEEQARRYFIRAEGMAEWAESAAGYGTGEETKFASYQLPGGTNYKELLLTLPANDDLNPRQGYRVFDRNGVEQVDTLRKEIADRELAANAGGRIEEYTRAVKDMSKNFRSSHFDQPNVLAHIRFNERTSADGKRVLFLEEIQSDWAQKGRKGGFSNTAKPPKLVVQKIGAGWEVYNETLGRQAAHENGDDAIYKTRAEAEAAVPSLLLDEYEAGGPIPSAPFVGKTEAWVALALKRMIRYAADNGFDAVAWTNGEQQADRYDLSKQLDSITVELYSDRGGKETYNITGYKDGNDVLAERDVPYDKIPDYIGKDAAEKVAAQLEERDSAKLTGLDLKVGGEGMRAFYDKIVPNVANDLLKKLGGGRVGTMKIATDSVKGVWEHHTDLPGFDLTPEMSTLAQRPNALFLEQVVTGDSGRQYTAAQEAFFANVGRTVGKESLKERVAGLWKDAGKKLAQGLVDQFAPIKDLSSQAYTLARLSKGASGAFEALLRFGKLSLRDGAYDVDTSGGVIQKVFAPLQGEGEDFLWWVASNRAARLSAEDREHLFTPADIAAGRSLASGQAAFDYTLQNGARRGQVTRERADIFSDALKSFDAFNRNVMDMAEQSGLVDGASRAFWEHEFYVPFYRVAEGDNVRGMNIKSGLVRQEAFKKLKGGSEKINADLLANTLRNWAHLIDASAKNRAAKATLEAAERLGVAVEAPEDTVRQIGRSTGLSKGVAWFADAGRARFYLVEDPFVLTAINGLEFAGLRGPLMDAMSQFKHWLTIGVTASPFFKVRNLIRDSVHSIAVSGLSYNPLANVKEGFKASNHEGQMYASIMASGGIIHFGTMLESREADRVRQLVKNGVKNSTILDGENKLRRFYDTMIEPAIAAYNELGNRSEEINRAALYKQLIDKGMDHAQASLLARDLMDFSMQGAWTGIRFLTQTVPFLNARMQGLYKLGRAVSDDPRKVAVTLGATAMASIALMLAYMDDDDWKKREDWDRDNFWWFKLGGTAFRIPKPFEIGSMASVAERGLELMISDEMTGKRFGERMLALTADNLGMNPVPQLVKPVLDIYANKDSFTGRPVEGMGMERLRPDARYNQRTSMFARAASTAGNAVTGVADKSFLSPVQIDHLVRGYFGWLGTFVVAGADMVARPATGQMPRPEVDYAKLLSGGMAADLPSPESRYVTQMYGQAKSLEQAYATWRDMQNKGDAVLAQAFAQQNMDQLKQYGMVERVKRAQSEMNKRIRQIEVDGSLSPTEKRDAISRIQAQKDRSARLLAAGLRHSAVQ